MNDKEGTSVSGKYIDLFRSQYSGLWRKGWTFQRQHQPNSEFWIGIWKQIIPGPALSQKNTWSILKRTHCGHLHSAGSFPNSEYENRLHTAGANPVVWPPTIIEVAPCPVSLLFLLACKFQPCNMWNWYLLRLINRPNKELLELHPTPVRPWAGQSLPS